MRACRKLIICKHYLPLTDLIDKAWDTKMHKRALLFDAFLSKLNCKIVLKCTKKNNGIISVYLHVLLPILQPWPCFALRICVTLHNGTRLLIVAKLCPSRSYKLYREETPYPLTVLGFLLAVTLFVS